MSFMTDHIEILDRIKIFYGFGTLQNFASHRRRKRKHPGEKMFNRNVAINVDSDYLNGHAMAKMAEIFEERIKSGCDMFYTNINPTDPMNSAADVTKFVATITDETPQVTQYDDRVVCFLKDSKQVIAVNLNSSRESGRGNPTSAEDDQNYDTTNIQAWGSNTLIAAIEKFKKPEKYDISITWSFTDSFGGISEKRFIIKEANYVHDEYVPFIKQGVESFIDSFMKSKSPILILQGPPGTGKTSFIRHMLYKRRLNSTVTFDEKIMTMDTYYINYMSSSKHDIMVVEDADVILHSRSKDDNKIMAKLLNVSDGLVPLISKKIIFSTNLDNVDMIDPAIMRPGRCFDVVEFRPLNKSEAVAARAKAGLPQFIDARSQYTLSEVFNGDVHIPETKRKIGII